MSLGWPGNAFGIPPEELEEVSGVREVWASLLRLLPPRPGPGSKRMKMDGWMDLHKFMYIYLHAVIPARGLGMWNVGWEGGSSKMKQNLGPLEITKGG
ncbi:hypothetical protein L3Q82_017115 [Scortum barcoo]|uniref:Uncharacterized protein n=1 Tax=Scortum barcoo TaxID=214431 RepID=A0ACB8XA14_9TELE|nr:hypothetical protein L3Q82_017115 [Scortum barcoo]